jgi:hypothetical protein
MRSTGAFKDIISITELRRDIDTLTKKLDRIRYTYVLKNQEPLFVAVEPALFEDLQETQKYAKEREKYRKQKIGEAMKSFKEVREKMGDWPATETVIKLRDEEYERWKTKS